MSFDWTEESDRLWICPECNQSSKSSNWEEVWLYCEDCGDHYGRKCPNCDEMFDWIWNDGEVKTG